MNISSHKRDHPEGHHKIRVAVRKGEQANEAQAAVEGDGEVLEQDTPGEFLVPETAPEVPAPTPTEAAPAAAAPAPTAPAATDATTAPAIAPSGDG